MNKSPLAIQHCQLYQPPASKELFVSEILLDTDSHFMGFAKDSAADKWFFANFFCPFTENEASDSAIPRWYWAVCLEDSVTIFDDGKDGSKHCSSSGGRRPAQLALPSYPNALASGLWDLISVVNQLVIAKDSKRVEKHVVDAVDFAHHDNADVVGAIAAQVAIGHFIARLHKMLIRYFGVTIHPMAFLGVTVEDFEQHALGFGGKSHGILRLEAGGQCISVFLPVVI